jgi:renalase
MKRIAIIGAGISGLVIAKDLSQKYEVVVFEKARGIGGRMSTRHAEPFDFDHGAQCFTARSKAFQNFIRTYFDKGIINEWKGKVVNLELGKKETERLWFETHFVASPNMNSLCKDLAKGLDIRFSCEISPLGEKTDKYWSLFDNQGVMLGNFDMIISTAPPEQTVKLFSQHLLPDNPLFSITMQGCYALMLGFNQVWDKPWISAKVRDNPIKWVSVNSSKPLRNNKVTSLVIHSRNDWSEAHIDNDLDLVKDFLMQQFSKVTEINPNKADYVSLHRWRYAIVAKTEKSGGYIDDKIGLYATSDWCATSRIEEAWLHAKSLAYKIANTSF